MLKFLISVTLLNILPNAVFGQKEVPITYKKEAFLITFKEPFKQIKLEFKEDLKEYYSNMDIHDSVMVFRSLREYNNYEDDLEKYKKVIKKALEEDEKAAKEGKQKKERKLLSPPDISVFTQKNKLLLKTGLDLEITYEEYRQSRLVLVKRIIIKTNLDAKDTYEGIFERLDGDVATIDGRAVKLKEKAQIVGKKGKGFEGKSFASFKDMMLGSIVEVKGKRHEDGILIAKEGEIWESSDDDLDRQIKTSLKNSMVLTAAEVKFSNQKFEIVQHPAIQTYVSKIGRAMIPQYQKDLDRNHPSKIDFNFYVVKDSTFNACAYPDGSIFIHSTLLEELENEAQLAAIIGHEIAHVTHKHSRKSFQTQKAVGTGEKIFKEVGKRLEKEQEKKTEKESYIEDATVLLTAFGGTALTSKYSRDLESQADRNGLTYMINAGYDPREAAKIWKRLSLLSDATQPEYHFGSNLLQAASKGIKTIYASHPESVERYKSLNRLLAQNVFEQGFENKLVGKDEYETFKKGLKRVMRGKEFDEPIEVAKPKEETSKQVNVTPTTKAEKIPASKATPKPKAPVKKKN